MATTNKLPRSLTLKSRKDIDRLLKHGKRKSGNYCTVVWEQADSFRYAVLVSGKIKGAVARNRLKRLFREAIRLNRNQLPFPIQLAVIVRINPNEPRFEDINREITSCIVGISGKES